MHDGLNILEFEAVGVSADFGGADCPLQRGDAGADEGDGAVVLVDGVRIDFGGGHFEQAVGEDAQQDDLLLEGGGLGAGEPGHFTLVVLVEIETGNGFGWFRWGSERWDGFGSLAIGWFAVVCSHGLLSNIEQMFHIIVNQNWGKYNMSQVTCWGGNILGIGMRGSGQDPPRVFSTGRWRVAPACPRRSLPGERVVLRRFIGAQNPFTRPGISCFWSRSM